MAPGLLGLFSAGVFFFSVFSGSGVYFGWAALEKGDAKDGKRGEGDENVGEVERGPWKCVANVGYSPTFAGEENAEKIVEGHLIGYKGERAFHVSLCLCMLALLSV